MTNKNNVTVKLEDIGALGLDDITKNSISASLCNNGSITLPKDILTILSDMRKPNNKYGAYSSKKMILEMSGINEEHKATISQIIKAYENKKRLIYLEIFEGLDVKSFDKYVEALGRTTEADIYGLSEVISNKCNISKGLAKDFIDVYMALNSYNGFIMEYLIEQIISINSRFRSLGDVIINGDLFKASILDLQWGIDTIIAPIDISDIWLPLQIKSYTNVRVKREKLAHTFNDHKDYKKLHQSLLERECKGNVYYLFYDINSLRICLIQNIQKEFTLAKSRELEHQIIINPIIEFIEVWELPQLLDELVEDIVNEYLDEDVTPTMANIKALEPNTKLHIDTITICK